MGITRTGIGLLVSLLLSIPLAAQVVNFASDSQSGEESAGSLIATVQLDAVSGSDIDIPFTISGTASEGLDFTVTGSPVTIPMGEMSADIEITLTDDSETEPDETVVLTLETPSLGSLGSVIVHTATIEDNDTPPVVTIISPADPTTVVQGTMVTFEGTADDAEDGDLAASLTWDSDLDNTIGNGGGPFDVGDLSVGTHLITASVTDGSGLTGEDNVTVTVNELQTEFITAAQNGLESEGTFTATVQLSAVTDVAVDVPFTVSGSATEGPDFTVTGSPLTIPAGQSSADIVITVNDDSETEPDETVILTLGTPTLGSLGAVTEHTATIEDDDTPPVVTIISPADPTTVVQGTMVTFEGTADDAEDGDLAASLTWDSDLDNTIGNGGGPFDVGDLSVGTHLITASVTDGSGLTGEDNVTVTVNELQTEFTTAAQNGLESEGTFTATVQLSAVTEVDVDVPFTVSGTATEGAGNDFTVTGSPLTIPAGQLSGEIVITVNDDSETEPDETVILTLGTPTLGSLGTITGHTATINDNDTPPQVTITAPADGTTEPMTTSILFEGTALDGEDGNLSADLSWESDLSGVFGSGPSFNYDALTPGTHVITAKVQDSDGLEGNDVIIVNITNTAPSVSISEPDDGTTVEEGTLIMFAASAVDAEEGNLSAGLTWIASLDGGIGSGPSISTATLSVGTQSITASVVDGGGLEGSDEVTVTVTAPNAAPTISIDAPSDSHTVVEGTNINFIGTADDLEDGVISENIVWSSNIDGNLGTGASININDLSVNTHTITASITDSNSETSTATITVTITANNAPVVTISSPADGHTVVEGTNIDFTGSATDVEDDDGVLTGNLSWDSNLDNNIGSGGSFNTSSLSIGTHTITASVTDSHGDMGSDAITVTITANNAPVVTISSPPDGHTVVEGTNIDFTGSVTDVEDDDGVLTGNLSWDSDLDNNIGSGGSFSTSSLSIGTHTITASVTDSHGDMGSDAITVIITANQPPTASSVSISGSTIEGQTLTGNYDYNDPENDPEGASTFRWLRGGVAITGATNQTYTLTSDDVDNNITFEVTPVAQTGASPGTAVISSPVGPIIAANSAPTNITLSNSDIEENQPAGTTVGNFSTTDPDNPGDSHTYTLVSGTGSADNGSFNIVDNQLQTAAVFNFEADNSLNIRVQTEDAEGATFEKAFTISVTNVNDPPVAVDDLDNSTSGTASITINVAANDTDEDGTVVPGSVAIATNPTDGSIVNNGDGTITYTPNNGFEGGDSFTYTIEDDLGDTSSPGTVVVTVGPNNPPVANDDLSNTTLEDVAIEINVIANDNDSDGSIDPASINIVEDPTIGTAVANDDGTVTYTPNLNANGTDEFTYEVDDNLGATSNKAKVVVTINPQNDPPVANDDSETTPEDTAVIIDVLANDDDLADFPTGALDPATVTIETQPSNGLAEVNTDGTITYTPNDDFNGSDNFTYTVRDNQNALSNVATVTVNVSSVNDPPTAVDDPLNSTTEEMAITIDVAANDTDSDGSIVPGSVALVDPPQNGIAVNNMDGTVTYTPNDDFSGNDSFTYTVEDDMGALSNTALVIIQVTEINDPPVAVDDPNNFTNEDVAITLNLTANDSDPEGALNLASIAIVDGPDNGSVTIFNNGFVQYTPDQDYNGPDSFSYTVEDNGGVVSNPALVSITINDINDPPIAGDDTGITDEDQAVTINLIENDSDVDGNLVIGSIDFVTNPTNGIILDNGNGTILYTPSANFNGQDNLSYTIEDDDNAVSNVAAVNITVNDINDAPKANDDAANVNEDTQITIDLVGNDTDIDGSVVPGSVILVSSPANGNAVVNPDGTVDYTPDQNFNGSDTFTYTVEDDDGALSNIATVTVSVNDVDDPVVANDDEAVTDEDLPLQIDILANDEDPDGAGIDPSTVNIVTSTENGTATLDQDGSVLYEPNLNFHGNDTFTYNVRNVEGRVSNIATVSITINDINDPPVAKEDSISVDEDAQSPLNILENDFDVDGTIEVEGIIFVSTPGNGSVEVINEQVVYTPGMDFTGLDSFTYTVTDDDGDASNEVTVKVNVRNVNDPPSDLILSNTFIHEDEPIQSTIGSFSTEDVDPNESFTYSLVAGEGSEDNGAFSIFGDQLISQVMFDQDQQEFYFIRVKTDDGESSLERSFKITIYSDQNPLGITPGDLPRYHPVTNLNETYNITVEEGLEIDRVIFRYRGITSPRENWTTLQLSSDDRFFESIVDASNFDELGIQYEFVVEATDGGSVNLSGYTYNEYQGEGLDFEELAFGDQIADYNIVTIPLVLDNGSIPAIFEDDLGTYDKTKWRLFSYKSGNLIEYTEGLNALERGRGYWLIVKDQTSIDTGPGTTELITPTGFNLQLDQGWTLIGNPYNFYISWLDVLDYNGVGGFDLDVTVHEGGYDQSGVLEPFQGAFVWADFETTLAIPLEKNTIIQGSRRGSSPVVNDENNWEIDLNLSTSSLKNQLSGFGMRQDANPSKDIYDRVRPPRFIEYLDIIFPRPEYFAKEFSRDVVPTSAEHIWEFTVETNVDDPEIRLEWSQVPDNDASSQLWLYHRDQEIIINMKDAHHYDFANQGTHNFAVYYGNNDFIERELIPGEAVLTATYPNPFNEDLTVIFSFPDQSASSSARLTVYDLMGRMVKALWEDEVKPGFHKVQWNGTNEHGSRISSGTYLLRLDIKGQKSIYRRVIKK